jgi:DNA-binding IclR family transcriptional regulator
VDHLWSEIDDAVLQCLAAGVAAPAEIGERLGMSEAAAGSILAMLAAEGKVMISRARLS